YLVTERFLCYNSGLDTPHTELSTKLFLTKQNGSYRWATDTLKGHYIQGVRYRDLVSDTAMYVKFKDINDTAWKKISVRDNHLMYPKQRLLICPKGFESNQWYYVSFFDQRYSAGYIFVDENHKFHITMISSGVSPI